MRQGRCQSLVKPINTRLALTSIKTIRKQVEEGKDNPQDHTARLCEALFSTLCFSVSLFGACVYSPTLRHYGFASRPLNRANAYTRGSASPRNGSMPDRNTVVYSSILNSSTSAAFLRLRRLLPVFLFVELFGDKPA